MTYFEESLPTKERFSMIDITAILQKRITESGVQEGLCVIHVPHTTAGVTINENADPDVVRDILFQMQKLIPNGSYFRHFEGNSDSHVMSTLFSASLTLIIHGGRAVLGTWQGVYFCEFDGPRSRRYVIKCLEA